MMVKLKNICLFFLATCGLLLYPQAAQAVKPLPATPLSVQIADYTAFPPFLPRVVSPNILFLLDYSQNMVRPAYGECSEIFSNCRTNFVQLKEDYDPSFEYSGYFDPGTDGKYTCDSTGCVKSATGEWKGNWLNWLAMTQFDVLKMVSVGGDADAAPEQGNPHHMGSKNLTAGRVFQKMMSVETCKANAPDAQCAPVTPLEIPNSWISTPASGVTTIFGTADSTSGVNQVPLPFDFELYGVSFPAETQISVNVNGLFTFTEGTIASKPANESLPTSNLYDYTIAPHWDNQEVDTSLPGGGGSSVKSFVRGTAPNRIFVMTFDKMIVEETDTGKDDPITYQVLLFEGSNHIVFQYLEVQPTKDHGLGRYATVGIQGSSVAGESVQYSFNTADLTNGTALLMTPDVTAFTVKTDNTANSETTFQPYGSTADIYPVWIAVNGIAKDASGACPTPGSFLNKYKDQCYDHRTEGLLQEFRDGEIAGLLGFRLGIMLLNDNDGGSITKHFNQKEDAGWASLITATRNATPKANAPLAEALYEALGYFKNDDSFDFGSDFDTLAKYDPYFFQSANQKVPCAKSYVLLVSSGNYSHDNATNIFGDTSVAESWTPTWSAGWRSTGESSGQEGTKANGGWLDNVAYELHTASKTPSPNEGDLRPATDLPQEQVVTLYTINTFGAESGDGTEVLKKAARYGGFTDLDGDMGYDSGDCSADPVVSDEADKNCDGRPDTYFSASTGSLRSQISNAVADILRNSASGTSVSVLSTSAGGEGALYQAYFYPAKVDANNREARWPGYLRSFFIDRYQNLRDDYSGGSSPDQKMVFSEDRVAQMFLDGDNAVKVKLYTDSDGDGQLSDTEKVSNPPVVEMDAVTSLWEAGKKLAQRDKSTRNIYFWADTGLDGFDSSSDGDFGAALLGPETFKLATNSTDRDSQATTLKPFLRAGEILYEGNTWVSAEDEAKGLIDFVLGKSVDRDAADGGRLEYRGRCIDVGATETGCPAGQSVWPLGDIVFSTPTLVAGPTERYDKIYADPEYSVFRNAYKNRRNVVYVGANDGMLHAFNAGVYHEGDDDTTDTTVVNGYFTDGPAWGSNGVLDVGEELWAFLPYDNLPHMSWLACNGSDNDPSTCGDSEYTHVYYADMRAKVTDVQIFADTATSATGIDGQVTSHPHGWGTILILGMRLGGGAMNLDLDTSGTAGDIASEKFRSAYYALDITDPEKPPRLLWRFYDDNLGFSTSYPAIVRIKNDSNVVGWYMVVGSGPKNAVGSGTGYRDYDQDGTTTNGKIFVVDLVDGTIAKSIDTGFANSIMGDPTTVDVDLDFSVDTIYIGSSFGPIDNDGGPGGRVYRINTKKLLPTMSGFGNWEFSTLFDPMPGGASTTIDPDPDAGKDMGPILIGPSVAKDKSGNLWVYFGSGQLKKRGDLTNSDQQRFYAIKDKCWKGLTTADGCNTTTSPQYAYSLSDLLNTSGAKVYELSATKDADHQVAMLGGNTAPCGGTNECSYATVLEQVKTKSGWYINLTNPTDAPSEKVLSKSSVLGGLVLFTTYEPSGDLCSIFGDSWLYSLFYETGMAYTKSTLGTYDESGEKVIKERENIGGGMPTSVGVAIGETVSGFIQKSTGEIKQIETEPAFKLKSGPSSWRQEPSGGGNVGLETIYKHIVK